MTLIPKVNVSMASYHGWVWGVALAAQRPTTTTGGFLTSKLSKDLNQSSEHKTLSPLGNLEHDQPAWCGGGLLSIDGKLDLVELRLDPLVV